MFFDRLNTKTESTGNDLVGITGDHMPHYVSLSVRESLHPIGGVCHCTGVFLVSMPIRDVASNRLKLTKLAIGSKQRPMRPVFPRRSSIPRGCTMLMYYYGILDAYLSELFQQFVFVILDYRGHKTRPQQLVICCFQVR